MKSAKKFLLIWLSTSLCLEVIKRDISGKGRVAKCLHKLQSPAPGIGPRLQQNNHSFDDSPIFLSSNTNYYNIYLSTISNIHNITYVLVLLNYLLLLICLVPLATRMRSFGHLSLKMDPQHRIFNEVSSNHGVWNVTELIA